MTPDIKIVWKHPDGSISVTTPVEPMEKDESESVYLDRIAAKVKASDPSLTLAVRISYIPGTAHRNADRYFRKAWTWETPDPVIDIDMEKAREVHRNQIRLIRKPKLDDLDVAYQRADEAGDTALKQIIATQKQALRDSPADPAIASAKTPEELKTILPQVLK